MRQGWDTATAEKFAALIAKVPVFLRDMAENKIGQKAEAMVKKENRLEVTEKDLVDACFAETPFGFHGPMKCDMQDIGIDYTKYGYDK